MRDYYFYTDPDRLQAQTSKQAFGPCDDETSDKFRTISLHSAVDRTAPAVAVCSGTICVQPGENGTLSIILKPDYQPPFRFPFIKYFIYKGIKKESLISDGNAIIPPGKIPFINRIHENWQDPMPAANGSNQPNPKTNSSDVIGIAFNNTILYSLDNLEPHIFSDDKPLDNFFYYPSTTFTLPTVKAGEIIGNFGAVFGFEIVLERLGYEPKIGSIRSLENIITTSKIDSPLNEDGYWTDQMGAYTVHWMAKEEATNFMDPCAFYGSFGNSGLFYTKIKSDNTPEQVNIYSYNDLYNRLISKIFIHKNRMYLRITDSYLHSYLLWKSTKKIIMLGYEVQQSWPDMYIDLANTSSSLDTYDLIVPSKKNQTIFFATQQKNNEKYTMEDLPVNINIVTVPLRLNVLNKINCSGFVEVCLEADTDFFTMDSTTTFYRGLNISSLKYRTGLIRIPNLPSNFGLFPFAQPFIGMVNGVRTISQMAYVIGDQDIYIITYPLESEKTVIRSLKPMVHDVSDQHPLTYFLHQTNIKSYRINKKTISYTDESGTQNLDINIIGKDFPYKTSLYHELYNILAIDRASYEKNFPIKSVANYISWSLTNDKPTEYNEYYLFRVIVEKMDNGDLVETTDVFSLKAIEAK